MCLLNFKPFFPLAARNIGRKVAYVSAQPQIVRRPLNASNRVLCGLSEFRVVGLARFGGTLCKAKAMKAESGVGCWGREITKTSEHVTWCGGILLVMLAKTMLGIGVLRGFGVPPSVTKYHAKFCV